MMMESSIIVPPTRIKAFIFLGQLGKQGIAADISQYSITNEALHETKIFD